MQIARPLVLFLILESLLADFPVCSKEDMQQEKCGGCIIHKSDGKCQECVDHFYPSEYLCLKGNLPHCRKYKSSTECLECTDSYYPVEGECKFNPYCSNFDSEEKLCLECISDAYYLNENRICAPRKNQFCKEKEPNEDTCKSCQKDYYLDPSKNCRPITLIDHCYQYVDSKNECKYCNRDHFKSKTKNECLPLTNRIHYCRIYVDDGVCFFCNKGRVNESNVCVTYVDNCKSYDLEYDHCVQCENNYFMDSRYECVKRTHVDNCFRYFPSMDLCQLCKNGYKFDGENHCIFDINCEQNDPQYNHCLKCKQGFVYDIVHRECIINFTPNCLTVNSDQQVCTKCESSTFLDQRLNQCIKRTTVENCKEYDPEADECKKCESSYYLDDNSCVYYMKGCATLRENKECEKCYENYENVDGTCQPKIEASSSMEILLIVILCVVCSVFFVFLMCYAWCKWKNSKKYEDKHEEKLINDFFEKIRKNQQKNKKQKLELSKEIFFSESDSPTKECSISEVSVQTKSGDTSFLKDEKFIQYISKNRNANLSVITEDEHDASSLSFQKEPKKLFDLSMEKDISGDEDSKKLKKMFEKVKKEEASLRTNTVLEEIKEEDDESFENKK